jgi:hypothetical protein
MRLALHSGSHSGQASLRRNWSGGSHSTRRRTTPRSTPYGSHHRSQIRSHCTSLRQAYHTAYLRRCHWIRIRSEQNWFTRVASGIRPQLDYNPSMGTATIPKRNLRVTKWLGTIPAVGVCTFCDRLLYVPLTALKKVADAQESLRVQFTEHKCKTQTDS